MLEVLKRVLKGDFRLPSLFERESEEEYMARFYQRIADDMAEDWRRVGQDLAQTMLDCSVRDQTRVTDEKTRATLKEIEVNMREFLRQSRKASRAAKRSLWF